MGYLSARCRAYCTAVKAISQNSLIFRFSREGDIRRARRVFDQILHKNTTSWNSMIAGYFQNRQPSQARHLFDVMPERNITSWNNMVSGYVKNGMLKEAQEVFDSIPGRNVVSWTAMLRGYVQEGMIMEAKALFERMPEKNVVSWTVMLGGLIRAGEIDEARRFFDSMPVKDVIARTTMIAGYCQAGKLAEARELFDDMPKRNAISWTTMINGYAQNQKMDDARKLFEAMPEKKDMVCWTAMIISYAHSGRTQEASELFNAMPVKTVGVCNGMIIGFGQKGYVANAREVFDSMKERDECTWSAMIKVYESNDFELEALRTFSLMQHTGIRPNFPALISILSVCGSLASVSHGRQIHAQVIRHHFDTNVYISSVLLTMYAKCGDLVKAKLVFDRFSLKDVVMWNSIITGYAQHGLADEAFDYFNQMLSTGISPDAVTFVGLLAACSYSGKVKEGRRIFTLMKTIHQIEPGLEHYACMVDLLGRAGMFMEAMDLIRSMPVEADAVVWGALLGACKIHMNIDLAEVATKKLIELEPSNSGHHVLLSNIYASQGRWHDVRNVRKKMKCREVKKLPGCSWIEVDKEVHLFTGQDSKSHPDYATILRKLDDLNGRLREAGYHPDGSFSLHDLDEEDKAQSLGYHSEKLAVAYGLLKVPAGLPIRVMKNLRVWGLPFCYQTDIEDYWSKDHFKRCK